jgi:hypothetical protein
VVHSISVLACLQGIRIAISGSPSSSAIRKIVGMLSLLWFAKKSVMHLPEQPGRARELRAFGGDLGVPMHFSQREMTKTSRIRPPKCHCTWLTTGCASARCCIRSRYGARSQTPSPAR